jgi:hypothetical protein
MCYTSGFDRNSIADACRRVACAEIPEELKNWPPSLGLFRSVAVTLCYKRHNNSQAKIGEDFCASQPTVSRAISVITLLLADCMREFVPAADDLDPEERSIVVGTLPPCRSWKNRPEPLGRD